MATSSAFWAFVVSHFLFLYSEQLDLDFPIAAFEELLRVAGEVGVYPLLALDRQWSPHVGLLREHLTRAGYGVEIGPRGGEAARGSVWLEVRSTLIAPPATRGGVGSGRSVAASSGRTSAAGGVAGAAFRA
jgi:hypothetical protein